VFRSGRDPYKVNAMALFGVAYDDVTGDQRQVGKVQELALGFLGGPGSFETFGRVYGVQVENVPRAIRVWRSANPWATWHGQALENAYTFAMRNVGREFPAGRVVYMFDGQHLWYALPSGRVLCYPYAKLEADGVSYLKASWKPAADATEWPRARLWRGLAVENVTQAVANDILRHALRRLEDVVLHVHDEVVVECADDRAAEVERVMCEPPAWAVGLPLAAEVKIMKKYGK
jgi:DNA polymerase